MEGGEASNGDTPSAPGPCFELCGRSLREGETVRSNVAWCSLMDILKGGYDGLCDCDLSFQSVCDCMK